MHVEAPSDTKLVSKRFERYPIGAIADSEEMDVLGQLRECAHDAIEAVFVYESARVDEPYLANLLPDRFSRLIERFVRRHARESMDIHAITDDLRFASKPSASRPCSK